MLMVQRVFLSKSPPRLITSKAGKNATPSLPDADKSFDSNWFDGGGIKWLLPRNTSGDFTAFPYSLNYIPYIWGFHSGVYTGNSRDFDSTAIQNASDRPPTGSTRYITPCDQFWYGEANESFFVTKAGITYKYRADIIEIDTFVVFEG